MAAMMELEEAKVVAERVMNENVRSAQGGGVVIFDEHTVESDEWWVFVYNTRAYLQSGDFRRSLVGNPPIMVNKATGEAKFGRTDISIDEQLHGRRSDGLHPIWQDVSDVFGDEQG
jgi:immunity protein 35 of polymorphic toxin system